MKEMNYRPAGELSGENTGPLPDKGTGTGMPDSAVTGGMSTNSEATNRRGGMGGATGSDAMDQCFSKDQRA